MSAMTNPGRRIPVARVVISLFCGVLGVLVVSWGLAEWVYRSVTPSHLSELKSFSDARLANDDGSATTFEIAGVRVFVVMSSRSKMQPAPAEPRPDFLPKWFGSVRPIVHDHLLLSGVESGWPMRAVRSRTRLEYTSTPGGPQVLKTHGRWDPPWAPWGTMRLSMEHPGLPWLPIFPGFLVNSVLYAAAAYLLLTLAVQFHRWTLLRRGRCPRCAYDLRHDLAAGCPECGWNRPSSEPERAPKEPGA